MTKPKEIHFYNPTDYSVFKYRLMKNKDMRLSFLTAFTNRDDIVDATLHRTDPGNRYPVVYECTTKKGDKFIAEIIFSKGYPWSDERKEQHIKETFYRHVQAKTEGLIGKNQPIYYIQFFE